MLEKWAVQIKLFNIPLAFFKRILHIYEIPYIFESFSSYRSVYQNLQELVIPCKVWFFIKKLLPESSQLCFSKGKNWIVVTNAYVGTPPERKAFVMTMAIQFVKVIFSWPFQKHCKKSLSVSRRCQTVQIQKSCLFSSNITYFFSFLAWKCTCRFAAF